MSSEKGRVAAEPGRIAAGHGAVSVQGADVLASAQRVTEVLQSALETLAVIDQALGFTMGWCGCTQADALERLLDRSQAEHQELAVIARGLVVGAVGGARTHRH